MCNIHVILWYLSYVTFQGNSEIWSHKTGGHLIQVYEMHCEEKWKLRSHITNYCLIEVDLEFQPVRLNQRLKLIFAAMHAALRGKNKDSLARNQNNVYELLSSTPSNLLSIFFFHILSPSIILPFYNTNKQLLHKIPILI
jgi:hypothetical protein